MLANGSGALPKKKHVGTIRFGDARFLGAAMATPAGCTAYGSQLIQEPVMRWHKSSRL